MKTKQRTRILIAVLILSLTVGMVPAAAAQTNDESEIQPCYIDLSLISASIDISTAGKATCNGYATTYHDTDEIRMTLYLQRLEDGKWVTVKYWSATGHKYLAMEAYRYVVPGYYYHTLTMVAIYDSAGKYVESASCASRAFYY